MRMWLCDWLQFGQIVKKNSGELMKEGKILL